MNWRTKCLASVKNLFLTISRNGYYLFSINIKVDGICVLPVSLNNRDSTNNKKELIQIVNQTIEKNKSELKILFKF